jgi:hypothetical protein
VLIAAVSLTGGCGDDLPKDFERLPLERQVKEYEMHLQKYGHPLTYARAAIAKHGFGAADLACDRLATSDQSLPAYEALQIVHLVQTGGCSLKQTRCESVVRSFVAGHPIGSTEGHFARLTLEAIERDYTSPTWHVGACVMDRRGEVPPQQLPSK